MESSKFDHTRFEGVIRACEVMITMNRYDDAYKLFHKHRLYSAPDGKGLLFFETVLYNGFFEMLGSIASFYADDMF